MITKAQGKACLEAMEKAAEGSGWLDSATSDALETIGWSVISSRDRFDVDSGYRYSPPQVLMALAWCVTLSGVK